VAIFALDANWMIAAVCDWHEQHDEAAAEVERRLAAGEQLSVAAQALAEAYAVLTRLPAPYRLTARDAWALLHANFVEDAKVEALDGASYVVLLERLAATAIGGGRTYDALIGECARAAGAGTLLTFNPRHFEPPPDGVSVVGQT
jgi:predicted nucleic acid-binding protein